jgi:hypothetical protein
LKAAVVGSTLAGWRDSVPQVLLAGLVEAGGQQHGVPPRVQAMCDGSATVVPRYCSEVDRDPPRSNTVAHREHYRGENGEASRKLLRRYALTPQTKGQFQRRRDDRPKRLPHSQPPTQSSNWVALIPSLLTLILVLNIARHSGVEGLLKQGVTGRKARNA